MELVNNISFSFFGESKCIKGELGSLIATCCIELVNNDLEGEGLTGVVENGFDGLGSYIGP